MFSLFRKRDEDPAEQREEAAAAPVDTASPAVPEETAKAASPSDPETATKEPAAPSAPAGDADQGFKYDALFSPPAADTQSKVEVGEADPARASELTPPIIEALRTVYDPEIPVNIYDLGLIYDIAVDANARAKITMTLTSPACPSAQQLPVEVEWKVKEVPGVEQAVVNVVWDPPWSKERMSEEARLALGMF